MQLNIMHEIPWKPTNTTELKAYIGVYVYAGIHKEPEIPFYWNTNGSAGALHPYKGYECDISAPIRADRAFLSSLSTKCEGTRIDLREAAAFKQPYRGGLERALETQGSPLCG